MKMLDELDSLDFLIYSSHKTSTQSLLSILKVNGMKSMHFHTIHNLKNTFSNIESEYQNQSEYKKKEEFTKNYLKKKIFEGIKAYQKKNGKKLSIVSIIRNPRQRLISSFFQSFHDDEIYFSGKKPMLTTVKKRTCEELYELYSSYIRNDTLPGGVESLDEMSFFFDTDILGQLQKYDDYYFFENDLIQLYVLDFEKVIGEKKLEYLNRVLKINLIKTSESNKTENKNYYEKYKTVKSMIGEDINKIIGDRYNSFYFTAFDKI